MNLHYVLFEAKRNTTQLTGAAVARKIGVSSNRYSDWLNYERSNTFPNDEQIVKLALMANLSPIKAFCALHAARCAIPELKKELEELAA